ncbi:MAG: DUF1254 domain-containing protein [Candidatus Obscuribacterales bacterium]|jgi:hypothetical protein
MTTAYSSIINRILASGLAVACLTGGVHTPSAFAQSGKASGKANASVPSVEETESIAEEGFIYGLPIVMNYAVMYQFSVNKKSTQYKAPFNKLFNESHVCTYKDTAVVTPNSDTPYSLLWLDLRAEPIVISVPAVEKNRYYAVQLIDGNTYNYGYIGSRATGNGAGDYLVVGPSWNGETPKGIKKVFRSSTQFGFACIRTQLFKATDMDNVKKVQAGYKAQTLSAYLHKPAVTAETIEFPYVDDKSVKENFFQYLDFALKYAPVRPEEKLIRAKLASIGIGPDKKISFKDLDKEHLLQVSLGVKAAEKKLAEYIATGTKPINSWIITSLFGDSAFYHGDWLKRAAAAKSGIYGNNAVEAVYPMTRQDITGAPLDGSKHRYTLTFPAGSLPPVNSFWSVTMYDGKSQLLIQNPINRYLINSPMLPAMKKNADGSLTIYIQKDSPGKDKESNWLPAPNDTIYLVMRLYWPKTEAPSILPPGSGAWKPPGVVVR